MPWDMQTGLKWDKQNFWIWKKPFNLWHCSVQIQVKWIDLIGSQLRTANFVLNCTSCNEIFHPWCGRQQTQTTTLNGKSIRTKCTATITHQQSHINDYTAMIKGELRVMCYSGCAVWWQYLQMKWLLCWLVSWL